jgi:16S rRNA (uracil1498-N3)-methyltransferase
VNDPAGHDTLRRAAAHVVVADLETPDLDDLAKHHLVRVLRLRDGEPVTVTDGRGSWRSCRFAGGELALEGFGGTFDRAEPVTIALAIPKADRPEWVVQKLTELGVDRIVLLHADRSVVRWDSQRAPRHVDKLRRVALEAVQQSRRVWLPVIEGPFLASAVLPDMPVAEPGGRALAPADRALAIGPEGGWSDDELAVASDRVRLGDGVLRVETAALAAGVRLVASRC